MSKTQSRWFDEGDFTPEHDEMMIDLMTNISKYLEKTFPDFIIEHDYKLIAEPMMEGYPPVFPDAIVNIEGQLFKNRRFKPGLSIVIEIKPKIDSFGSVMRQLKIYNSRHTTYEKIIILFTRDARYDSQFESQEITVVHPEVFL